MNHSEKIDELVKALIIVQSNLKPAHKDKENPFFHSEYASISAIYDTCRDLLAQNGLAVIQTTDIINDNTCLITTLAHSSGQWIRGYLPLNMVKKDPQSQGSAITYARRYALAAIVGVIQEDDDGEGATDRNKQVTASKDPLDYVIKYGKKYGGKKIKDVGYTELENYVSWIKKENHHEKSHDAKELVINFEALKQPGPVAGDEYNDDLSNF